MRLAKGARPHRGFGLIGQGAGAIVVQDGQGALGVHLHDGVLGRSVPAGIGARGPGVGILRESEVAVQVGNLQHVEGIQSRRSGGMLQGVQRTGVVVVRGACTRPGRAGRPDGCCPG